MGEANETLALTARPPVVILLAGLQGAGKTTTAGKLGWFLRDRQRKQVLAASVDIYRPAAIDQLERVADTAGIDFFRAPGDDPVRMAGAALEEAKRRMHDVLILDTAGRLHVDEDMMAEIRALNAALQPTEVLFVVDSLTGQDAVNAAQAFHDALPLSGVILTKTDGDARGGAALSVRQVTGTPIKFLGTGEGIEALEPFHPERVASRLLGMGDVLTLVEEAERKLDRGKAKELEKKLRKGKQMDLTDLRDQLLQMNSMGGMAGLLSHLPGMDRLGAAAPSVDDRQTRSMLAIIDSMTPYERNNPEEIRGSRKRRIAAGSGTQVQDVNRLLKQFQQMRKMMKRMRKGGMAKLAQSLGRRGGGGPFG
jgi:signal recognition particle subunit SRP54